jgi:predicted TIM-barrel fold metal-dependent hydrolase
MRTIALAEQDRVIYESEIRPYLPERLFDAHTHLLFDACHPRLGDLLPLTHDPMLSNVDFGYLRTWWAALFPGLEVNGLVMGFPTEGCDWRGENELVARQVRGSASQFSMLVHPETPADALEAEILRLGPVGLKPYMTFVRGKSPNDISITDMIPEAHLEIADRHGLAVTLHVARARGMADPGNLDDIQHLVRQFPRCQFILAHCGRCFIAPNMEAALDRLPVAENLWLDTSAVCDLGVFIPLFQRYDSSRILFGTDLVTATAFRGAYVRLGLSWHVCTPDMVAGLPPRATFAAYENLAVLCRAARFCNLDQRQLRGIFYDNSARLFDLGLGSDSSL